jgi:hypothetical protein
MMFATLIDRDTSNLPTLELQRLLLPSQLSRQQRIPIKNLVRLIGIV